MPKTKVAKKDCLQKLIDEDINFEAVISKIEDEAELNLDDAKSNAEDAMGTMSEIYSNMPREYCEGLCEKAMQAESEAEGASQSVDNCKTEIEDAREMLTSIRNAFLLSIKRLTQDIKTLEGSSKEAVLGTVSLLEEVLDY